MALADLLPPLEVLRPADAREAPPPAADPVVEAFLDICAEILRDSKMPGQPAEAEPCPPSAPRVPKGKPNEH